MQKLLPFILMGIIVASSSCGSSENDKLTIATSANMQFAMEELRKAFELETGIASNMVISSSGKLCAQIMEGAPYDVFVSADLKYPERLYQEGKSTAAPVTYAFGKVVLWSTRPNLSPSFSTLNDPSTNHVALPNPRTAPYGVAAMEILEKLGIQASVEDNLVYGESISQTNQFISTGSADLGFTALSVVKNPIQQVKGNWMEIPDSLYTPIQQGAVVIRNRAIFLESGERFLAFLLSTEAKSILNSFGYKVN